MANDIERALVSDIRRGDDLRVEGWPADELVRDVHVTLHMANGVDITLGPDEVVNRVVK